MRKLIPLLAAVSAAALLFSAPARPASLDDQQKKEIEQLVRDYLLQNPEILREMSENLQAKERIAEEQARGATLKDNTRIAFGPGSEFRIEDFRYAPAEGRLGLAATLLRGTLDFVSGIVTRLRPESTVLRTPTSTVGIRGPHILVKVDE